MVLPHSFCLQTVVIIGNEIFDKAVQIDCEAVIPPKRNRKKQRDYDKNIYRVRHLVENTFLHLKRWRGIATRYAKMVLAFAAAVQIAVSPFG